MTPAGGGNLFEQLVERFPENRTETFLRTPQGDRFSYADLDRISARYANVITAAGIGPGDRVAVQVDKSPQALFLYLACLRAGAAYLPMNVAYKQAEVAHIVRDADPALMVCRPGTEDECREVGARAHLLTLGTENDGTLVTEAATVEEVFSTRERGPQDLAALLYTSGTTGRPKGVMLTHRNLASNAFTLHDEWGWRRDDVLLHALPLFHTHGLFVACHCVLAGGSEMVFLNRFDLEQVLSSMRAATVFMGVPTFYTRLLGSAEFDRETCASVRLFVSGSAPLLEPTFREFEQRTGHAILERYGMTETGMNTSNPLNGVRKPGTVGKALADVEIRLVDEDLRPVTAGDVGEVQVKGPNVFSGYWRQPDKTAEEFTEDGFFRTGDLGRLDEDGYIVLVGRSKDLVISGGYNVYPKEVELLIDDMEGVVESAVIGLPHADLGESVSAVVVAEAHAGLDAERIIDSLKTQLAGYKVPKSVVFVEALPRNAMGKVQKNLLRERLG